MQNSEEKSRLKRRTWVVNSACNRMNWWTLRKSKAICSYYISMFTLSSISKLEVVAKTRQITFAPVSLEQSVVALLEKCGHHKDKRFKSLRLKCMQEDRSIRNQLPAQRHSWAEGERLRRRDFLLRKDWNWWIRIWCENCYILISKKSLEIILEGLTWVLSFISEASEEIPKLCNIPFPN